MCRIEPVDANRGAPSARRVRQDGVAIRWDDALLQAFPGRHFSFRLDSVSVLVRFDRDSFALVVDLSPVALRADAAGWLMRVAEVEEVADLIAVHAVAVILNDDIEELLSPAPIRLLGISRIDGDAHGGGIRVPGVAQRFAEDFLRSFEVLGDLDELAGLVDARPLAL